MNLRIDPWARGYAVHIGRALVVEPFSGEKVGASEGLNRGGDGFRATGASM